MFEAVHAKRYAERMTAYLGLGMQSHVIELASHDGRLLQHFSKLGIPVIGIEPDHASAVRAMKARGIPTLTGSFGRDMARRLAADGIDADLMVANNALFRYRTPTISWRASPCCSTPRASPPSRSRPHPASRQR